MKQKSIAAVTFFAIMASFVVHAADIQVSDLNDGKVTLIGRLGRPLGTVVTVEGQLVSDPRQVAGRMTATLRVRTVDGKALENGQIIGLIFRASERVSAVRANQLVKLAGYEGGSFIGTPEAARDLLGGDASPLDWKFQSMIRVIKLF